MSIIDISCMKNEKKNCCNHNGYVPHNMFESLCLISKGIRGNRSICCILSFRLECICVLDDDNCSLWDQHQNLYGSGVGI